MIVHMSNIEGLGAVRLVESLLPELLSAGPEITEIVTPDHPAFLTAAENAGVRTRIVRRRLPKSVSRAAEIVFPGFLATGSQPVLVLGDMPLRGVRRQIVFVQNPHLVAASGTAPSSESMKLRAMRALFRATCRSVDRFIVQTEVMKTALASRFGIAPDRIRVIPQPAPAWIPPRPASSVSAAPTGGLRLLYPARAYPHKNHRLLSAPQAAALDDVIDRLVLTVPAAMNPNPRRSWIECVGELEPPAMMDRYEACDALLFLSLSESYGLPLVEAMLLRKRIVCADLPYARSLCGDGAIYFDPTSFASLDAAIRRLAAVRVSGPPVDWTDRLALLPGTWSEVATRFLDVCRRAG